MPDEDGWDVAWAVDWLRRVASEGRMARELGVHYDGGGWDFEVRAQTVASLLSGEPVLTAEQYRRDTLLPETPWRG